MKRTQLICLAVLVCVTAHAQLTLNSGDVWVYQFNDLPFTGNVSVFTTNPVGALSFTVNNSSFQAGDSLRYEMFENSPAEAPFFSGIMNSAPPFTQSGQRASAWQDRQGAIRFTMLSGSATIDSISLTAIVSGPSLSSYDVYSSTFTPIPEPRTVLLLGAAFCMGLICCAGKRAKAIRR